MLQNILYYNRLVYIILAANMHTLFTHYFIEFIQILTITKSKTQSKTVEHKLNKQMIEYLIQDYNG